MKTHADRSARRRREEKEAKDRGRGGGGEGGAGAAAVLFLHGFPELWYSWRHQMEHLAGRGFRCLAPDLRGYGDTDAPPEIESYSAFHVVGDLVALLDALGLAKVRTSLADATTL